MKKFPISRVQIGVATAVTAVAAWLLSVLALPTLAAANAGSTAPAFCGCQAEQPKYSAAELQAGLDKAIDTSPLSPEEKARLHAGASAINDEDTREWGGWVTPPDTRVHINTPALRGIAAPGSSGAVDVIAAICRHEIYHFPPPTPPPNTGGFGPNAGGVTLGHDGDVSMCPHIGLQYWGAVMTCQDAAAAAASGNTAAANALCKLFRGQLRALQPGGEYYEHSAQCVDYLFPHPPPAAGPPSWGFTFPPYPATQGCEACLNYGGTGAYL